MLNALRDTFGFFIRSNSKPSYPHHYTRSLELWSDLASCLSSGKLPTSCWFLSFFGCPTFTLDWRMTFSSLYPPSSAQHENIGLTSSLSACGT